MCRITASKGRKLVVTMAGWPSPSAQATRSGALRPRSALMRARSIWLMVQGLWVGFSGGGAVGKQRLGIDGVALVEAWEQFKLALGIGGIHPLGQHRAAKARALHLHELVDQHITRGADFASKATAAQQKGLAERTAIGEVGEVQIHAFHAFQRQGCGVGIVGQRYHAGVAFRRGLGLWRALARRSGGVLACMAGIGKRLSAS